MVNAFSYGALLVLYVCVALNAYRIVRGPTMADRAVAADAIFLNLVGLAAVYSVFLRTAFYFDLVLAFSLLGFIGTVCFSKYLANGRIFE